MNIKQHDQLNLRFRAQIDLSDAESVRFLANKMTRPNEPHLDITASVDPEDSRVVVVPITSQHTSEPGSFNVEIETTWADGSVITLPNKGYLSLVIEPDLGGHSEE